MAAHPPFSLAAAGFHYVWKTCRELGPHFHAQAVFVLGLIAEDLSRAGRNAPALFRQADGDVDGDNLHRGQGAEQGRPGF